MTVVYGLSVCKIVARGISTMASNLHEGTRRAFLPVTYAVLSNASILLPSAFHTSSPRTRSAALILCVLSG